VDCHDQNYLALPGGPCGYKAKSESEETKSLVWLTKCFGAGCGKSLARVLLKEAVVVLGCRFCVPRAVNTVLDPLYVLLIRDPTPLLKTAAVYPP
jgi:hypothetical protein